MNLQEIMPGDRVKVFDHHLFKDDVVTPLSTTMQSATVVCRYGYKAIDYSNVEYDEYGGVYGEPNVYLYPDCVDVIFDHDGRLSRGHFTYGVERL